MPQKAMAFGSRCTKLCESYSIIWGVRHRKLTRLGEAGYPQEQVKRTSATGWLLTHRDCISKHTNHWLNSRDDCGTLVLETLSGNIQLEATLESHLYGVVF
mmetsp:Transcript_57627/g.95270  ORF Transcript_57627/g.95270 Transcript_57627/m.95270 type:complete len:101 (-) Transcript_57627:577-879(-)